MMLINLSFGDIIDIMLHVNDSDYATDYSIRAEGLNAIDLLLEELDIDAQQVFDDLELDIHLLHPNNRNEVIPYTKFLRLLNHCAAITGRQDFGALLSSFQDMSVIGMTGQAMIEAPSIRVAVDNLIEFFHLHMNGLKVSFEEYQRESLITLQVVMPFAPSYRQQVELSLGIGLRFTRRLLGQSWSPTHAYFEHQKDSGTPTISKLFACPISYESEFNGYLIRNQELDILRADFNSQLHQILHDYLCLQTRSTKSNFVVDVRENIINALHSGLCGIEELCQSMGLQRRSLQRKLAETDHSYKALLEETRMDLAQRYLKTPGISVTQISDILCYSDPTGFSRAFRRFFGVSPRHWRSLRVKDRQ